MSEYRHMQRASCWYIIREAPCALTGGGRCPNALLFEVKLQYAFRLDDERVFTALVNEDDTESVRMMQSFLNYPSAS